MTREDGGRRKEGGPTAAGGDGAPIATNLYPDAPSPAGMAARRVGRFGVLYGVATLFVVFAALPFAWMVVTVFKQSSDLYNGKNNPLLFNDPPTLDNVRLLWNDTNYRTFIENTLFVAALVVVITLVVAVPAAYSLTRLAGRWGEGLGIAIFMVYLVPPTLLFIPMTRVIAELGLKNSRWSMVVVYPSFTIPFCIWLLMGFFKSIPRELEDAALVDGASRIRTLFWIVFPISLPGILTVVIFTFSLCMNEFIYAIAFITSSDSKVVSTGIYTELIRGDVFYWGALMAATLIPAIPLALLYNTFLDRFIAGFTGGAFR